MYVYIYTYIYIYIKNNMDGFYTTCRVHRKFETCLLKVKIHHVYFSLPCKHIWEYFEENCWRIYLMLFYMLLIMYSDKEEPTAINYINRFYGETPGDV